MLRDEITAGIARMAVTVSVELLGESGDEETDDTDDDDAAAPARKPVTVTAQCVTVVPQ